MPRDGKVVRRIPYYDHVLPILVVLLFVPPQFHAPYLTSKYNDIGIFRPSTCNEACPFMSPIYTAANICAPALFDVQWHAAFRLGVPSGTSICKIVIRRLLTEMWFSSVLKWWCVAAQSEAQTFRYDLKCFSRKPEQPPRETSQNKYSNNEKWQDETCYEAERTCPFMFMAYFRGSQPERYCRLISYQVIHNGLEVGTADSLPEYADLQKWRAPYMCVIL